MSREEQMRRDHQEWERTHGAEQLLRQLRAEGGVAYKRELEHRICGLGKQVAVNSYRRGPRWIVLDEPLTNEPTAPARTRTRRK